MLTRCPKRLIIVSSKSFQRGGGKKTLRSLGQHLTKCAAGPVSRLGTMTPIPATHRHDSARGGVWGTIVFSRSLSQEW